jgi:hypothetical protein
MRGILRTRAMLDAGGDLDNQIAAGAWGLVASR